MQKRGVSDEQKQNNRFFLNFKYEILESGNDYEYGWQVREPYYIKKLK